MHRVSGFHSLEDSEKPWDKDSLQTIYHRVRWNIRKKLQKASTTLAASVAEGVPGGTVSAVVAIGGKSTRSSASRRSGAEREPSAANRQSFPAWMEAECRAAIELMVRMEIGKPLQICTELLHVDLSSSQDFGWGCGILVLCSQRFPVERRNNCVRLLHWVLSSTKVDDCYYFESSKFFI